MELEQDVRTLDLPEWKIRDLRSIHKHYCSDLSKSDLESLQVSSCGISQTVSALDLLEVELNDRCILSFNTELDKILRDEIVPKRITELTGYPGSGRTQICLQLCITTQLPKQLGGVEGQVVYISTNKNFAPHRLRELSKKFISQVGNVKGNYLTEDNILRNIFVFSICSIIELYAAVRFLELFLKDKTVKLVIIDSISNLLREVESKERTATTYKLLNRLQDLSTIFNFAIIITNDFTTRVKDHQVLHTASFGDSFFDRVNTRICLSKIQNIYEARLVKSIVKPSLKVYFSMFGNHPQHA